MVSGFKGPSTPSITDIAPIKVIDYIEKYSNRDMLGARMKGHMPIPVLEALRYPLEVCDAFWNDVEVKKLMNTTFDLLMLDGAYPECALGLVHIYQKPFMYFNTVAFFTGSIERAGSINLFSMTPAFASGFTNQMTFWERVQNASWHLMLNFLHWVSIMLVMIFDSILIKHVRFSCGRSSAPQSTSSYKNTLILISSIHMSCQVRLTSSSKTEIRR